MVSLYTNFLPKAKEKFRRSAKTLGYEFKYLPGDSTSKGIVDQVLGNIPDSYYFCYCETTYPDGSKDFVLYLRKMSGAYDIRDPEKEDIYLNGKKYTGVYKTTLKLEDKISKVISDPSSSYETNFPGLGEQESIPLSEKKSMIEESTKVLEKASRVRIKGIELMSPEILKAIVDKWDSDDSCDLLIIELEKNKEE